MQYELGTFAQTFSCAYKSIKVSHKAAGQPLCVSAAQDRLRLFPALPSPPCPSLALPQPASTPLPRLTLAPCCSALPLLQEMWRFPVWGPGVQDHYHPKPALVRCNK